MVSHKPYHSDNEREWGFAIISLVWHGVAVGALEALLRSKYSPVVRYPTRREEKRREDLLI